MSVGVRAIAMWLSLVSLSSCGIGRSDAPAVSPSSVAAPATVTDAQGEPPASSPDSAISEPEEVVLTATVASESFTEASAAQVAARRVSQTQHMMYGDDVELAEIVGTATTSNGRRALRTLIDDELAPVRNALATAPRATTWFVVRPLSVSIPILDSVTGSAETTVWTVEVFSRVGVVDPEMLFFETDVTLIWDGDGWKLDGYTVRPGPVARLGPEQYPLTAAELELRLENHRLVDPVTLEGWGI